MTDQCSAGAEQAVTVHLQFSYSYKYNSVLLEFSYSYKYSSVLVEFSYSLKHSSVLQEFSYNYSSGIEQMTTQFSVAYNALLTCWSALPHDI